MLITWVSVPEIQTTVPRRQDQDVCYYRPMLQTRTAYLESGPRCLKSRQICTEMMGSVPENPGLTIKDNMSVIWVSIPEMQVNVPRNQDQDAYHHRQIPETKKTCMESAPRCLKSRQISTEMMDSVPENPGLTINDNMSMIWASMPEIHANASRKQDQVVSYHRQIPETRTVCLESGPRCLKSRQMYTEIMVSVTENQEQYAHNLGQYA